MTRHPAQALQLGRALALLLLWLLAASASASHYTAEQKLTLVEAIGHRLQRSAVAFGADFHQWPTFVAKHQPAIDEANNEKELEEALRNALAEFKLSHLSLFSPSSSKLSRQGKRTGLGISIRLQDNPQGLFVTYVLPYSPAWLCGIQKLDILLSIDGQPITAIEQLAGEVGDRRELTWRRGDQILSGIAEYGPFPTAARSSMLWIANDVALIRVTSFQRHYYDIAAINRFFREARDARAIVLDLRNNRGGLAFFSRHLASKFGNRNDLFSLKVDKRRLRKAMAQLGDDAPSLATLANAAKKVRPLPCSRNYKGKVVVLVDNLSASGADMLPAYLKAHNKAIVLGDTTAGALQLARTFPLPYGFRLYAPIAELLTPDGLRLEGQGLEPNVKLDYRQTADDAYLLRRALELIAP